jgi:hypothetical protein
MQHVSIQSHLIVGKCSLIKATNPWTLRHPWLRRYLVFPNKRGHLLLTTSSRHASVPAIHRCDAIAKGGGVTLGDSLNSSNLNVSTLRSRMMTKVAPITWCPRKGRVMGGEKLQLLHLSSFLKDGDSVSCEATTSVHVLRCMDDYVRGCRATTCGALWSMISIFRYEWRGKYSRLTTGE